MQLMTKTEQEKFVQTSGRASADTPAQGGSTSNGQSIFTSTADPIPNVNFMGQINLYLQKEVIPGTKIKWLHVLLVAVAYVGYVELVAERKQKSKLKFW
ncbi:hypothetical protein [Soonwooa purpurea]